MDELVKILIVEDEILVAASIKRMLHDIGCQTVEIAASGASALHELGKGPVDLVLMDIKIKGGMDGIETAEKIRTLYRFPIVYITAHTDPEMLRRAKRTDPFGYIVKPIELRDLLSTVEMALNKHKSEEVLRASEDKYRTLVEGAGLSIFTIGRNGIILFSNETGKEAFGDPSDVLTGKTVQEVFGADIGARLMGQIASVLQTARCKTVEAVIIKSKQRKYEFGIHPLKNKQGRLESVMAIASEIIDQNKDRG
jgi:PAS domain S-box-containing protein